MTNENLARDYIARAHGRRKAVQVLFQEKLFADVVRESQESLELALKALIRWCGHQVPYSHDVSPKLESIRSDVPDSLQAHLERFSEISRKMRRDRELSFYGSEDITPSEFYDVKAAQEAMSELDEVLKALPVRLFDGPPR